MVTTKDKLKDLQGKISTLIRNLNGMESWYFEYGVIVPIKVCINELLDTFKHMQGWVDCMLASCEGI